MPDATKLLAKLSNNSSFGIIIFLMQCISVLLLGAFYLQQFGVAIMRLGWGSRIPDDDWVSGVIGHQTAARLARYISWPCRSLLYQFNSRNVGMKLWMLYIKDKISKWRSQLIFFYLLADLVLRFQLHINYDWKNHRSNWETGEFPTKPFYLLQEFPGILKIPMHFLFVDHEIYVQCKFWHNSAFWSTLYYTLLPYCNLMPDNLFQICRVTASSEYF